MKFVFFLFIFVTIDTLTNAKRRIFSKRDAFNCADSVSRIASDIAAKAALEAKNNHCVNYDCTSGRICSVKQKLADKAIEAARVTQSNLASKLALVNELADERQTVTTLLHELILSKKQLEDAIDKEIVALAMASTLTDVLDKALKLASEVMVNSDIVFSAVSNNIKSIDRILDVQNEQYRVLLYREQCAKTDLEATRQLEKEAVAAATNAKNNAFEIERQRERDYV